MTIRVLFNPGHSIYGSTKSAATIICLQLCSYSDLKDNTKVFYLYTYWRSTGPLTHYFLKWDEQINKYLPISQINQYLPANISSIPEVMIFGVWWDLFEFHCPTVLRWAGCMWDHAILGEVQFLLKLIGEFHLSHQGGAQHFTCHLFAMNRS